MSEVDRLGREPIEVLTLHQDFCELTWGQGDCLAGIYENIVPDSFGFSGWSITGGAIETGFGDPLGESNAIRIVSSGSSSATFTDASTDWVLTQSEPITVSLYVKNDVRSSGIFLDYIITGTVDGGFRQKDARVHFQYAGPSISDEFDNLGDFGYEPLPEGWYRIWFTIDPAAFYGGEVIDDPESYVSVNPFFDSPEVDAAALIFGPQIGRYGLQQYRATTGGAVIVESLSAQPCFNTRFTCQAIVTGKQRTD